MGVLLSTTAVKASAAPTQEQQLPVVTAPPQAATQHRSLSASHDTSPPNSSKKKNVCPFCQLVCAKPSVSQLRKPQILRQLCSKSSLRKTLRLECLIPITHFNILITDVDDFLGTSAIDLSDPHTLRFR